MSDEQGNLSFCAKDVAGALGYLNSRKAIRDHVDNEDKLTERFVLSGQKRVETEDSVKHGLLDKRGCNQKTIFINESGLYALINTSLLTLRMTWRCGTSIGIGRPKSMRGKTKPPPCLRAVVGVISLRG